MAREIFAAPDTVPESTTPEPDSRTSIGSFGITSWRCRLSSERSGITLMVTLVISAPFSPSSVSEVAPRDLPKM